MGRRRDGNLGVGITGRLHDHAVQGTAVGVAEGDTHIVCRARVQPEQATHEAGIADAVQGVPRLEIRSAAADAIHDVRNGVLIGVVASTNDGDGPHSVEGAIEFQVNSRVSSPHAGCCFASRWLKKRVARSRVDSTRKTGHSGYSHTNVANLQFGPQYSISKVGDQVFVAGQPSSIGSQDQHEQGQSQAKG